MSFLDKDKKLMPSQFWSSYS